MTQEALESPAYKIVRKLKDDLHWTYVDIADAIEVSDHHVRRIGSTPDLPVSETTLVRLASLAKIPHTQISTMLISNSALRLEPEYRELAKPPADARVLSVSSRAYARIQLPRESRERYAEMTEAERITAISGSPTITFEDVSWHTSEASVALLLPDSHCLPVRGPTVVEVDLSNDRIENGAYYLLQPNETDARITQAVEAPGAMYRMHPGDDREGWVVREDPHSRSWTTVVLGRIHRVLHAPL